MGSFGFQPMRPFEMMENMSMMPDDMIGIKPFNQVRAHVKKLYLFSDDMERARRYRLNVMAAFNPDFQIMNQMAGV